MTYVKTYLPTLKTHVVNLKRDAKDLSRDLQRLEVRSKLGSKTLYYPDKSHISFLTIPPHLQLISSTTTTPKCRLHSVLLLKLWLCYVSCHRSTDSSSSGVVAALSNLCPENLNVEHKAEPPLHSSVSRYFVAKARFTL